MSDSLLVPCSGEANSVEARPLEILLSLTDTVASIFEYYSLDVNTFIVVIRNILGHHRDANSNAAIIKAISRYGDAVLKYYFEHGLPSKSLSVPTFQKCLRRVGYVRTLHNDDIHLAEIPSKVKYAKCVKFKNVFTVRNNNMIPQWPHYYGRITIYSDVEHVWSPTFMKSFNTFNNLKKLDLSRESAIGGWLPLFKWNSNIEFLGFSTSDLENDLKLIPPSVKTIKVHIFAKIMVWKGITSVKYANSSITVVGPLPKADELITSDNRLCYLFAELVKCEDTLLKYNLATDSMVVYAKRARAGTGLKFLPSTLQMKSVISFAKCTERAITDIRVMRKYSVQKYELQYVVLPPYCDHLETLTINYCHTIVPPRAGFPFLKKLRCSSFGVYNVLRYCGMPSLRSLSIHNTRAVEKPVAIVEPYIVSISIMGIDLSDTVLDMPNLMKFKLALFEDHSQSINYSNVEIIRRHMGGCPIYSKYDKICFRRYSDWGCARTRLFHNYKCSAYSTPIADPDIILGHLNTKNRRRDIFMTPAEHAEYAKLIK